MNSDPEAELIMVQAQLRGMREALNEEGRKRLAERAARARAEDSCVKALRLLTEGKEEMAKHVLHTAISAANVAKKARKADDS